MTTIRRTFPEGTDLRDVDLDAPPGTVVELSALRRPDGAPDPGDPQVDPCAICLWGREHHGWRGRPLCPVPVTLPGDDPDDLTFHLFKTLNPSAYTCDKCKRAPMGEAHCQKCSKVHRRCQDHAGVDGAKRSLRSHMGLYHPRAKD